MFLIKEQKEGNTLTLTVEGDITSKTADEFNRSVEGRLKGLDKLILDFAGVGYLTSAGLRIVLYAQQEMEDQDAVMIIRNANDDIIEVFEMTGFSDVLTIE
ncbi:MAG: STAS domain-containing protein [Butyrivibrio sp.]|nr:STAS domain-containing protein [Butyrivibrio sp.]